MQVLALLNAAILSGAVDDKEPAVVEFFIF